MIEEKKWLKQLKEFLEDDDDDLNEGEKFISGDEDNHYTIDEDGKLAHYQDGKKGHVYDLEGE